MSKLGRRIIEDLMVERLEKNRLIAVSGMSIEELTDAFMKGYRLASPKAAKDDVPDDLRIAPKNTTNWIPVSERLPEEDTDVLVTIKCGLIGILQKKLADDDNGEPCYIWQDFEGEEHEVIAWMPLPKLYEPQESDHKCHSCKHYTSGEHDGSCGSYICKEYSNWESEEP